jgi:excinuclease ABC subunit B
VRGDVVEVHPSYEELAVRIELFGDEIDRISIIDPLRGTVIREKRFIRIFAKSHYVTTRKNIERAIGTIGTELDGRLTWMQQEGKLLEAQRLEQRTRYDLEMLREMSFCTGIENYSRHLSGRSEGEPPHTLFDYLPDNALLIVDESHVSLPQLRGMYGGDRSRKTTLVHHGFRLPSALDNRPLNFEEFTERQPQTVYVSATPAAYELERTGGVVVEQVIRPTGLMDPLIEVRPASGQVDDLHGEIVKRVEKGHRVLVTTLTKRMAEDLTDHFEDLGLRVRYLHADVETLERVRLLRELRQGKYDVLVGINLLREGLDLPEVSLVAVLDADKEGFLRSSGSLIQIAGRAARNVEGLVIFYADTVTDSMRRCMEETERRRTRQLAYNEAHGITPQSIVKSIDTVLDSVYEADYAAVPEVRGRKPGAAEAAGDLPEYLDEKSRSELVDQLEREMTRAAADLEFEKAAELRDRIKALRESAIFGD